MSEKLSFLLDGCTVLAMVFGLFGVAVSVIEGYSTVELNTSFSQRINIIAPYVDEQTEEFLKSKWAGMKSRTDFLSLDREIEAIAAKNKISLPKNLLE